MKCLKCMMRDGYLDGASAMWLGECTCPKPIKKTLVEFCADPACHCLDSAGVIVRSGNIDDVRAGYSYRWEGN